MTCMTFCSTLLLHNLLEDLKAYSGLSLIAVLPLYNIL